MTRSVLLPEFLLSLYALASVSTKFITVTLGQHTIKHARLSDHLSLLFTYLGYISLQHIYIYLHSIKSFYLILLSLVCCLLVFVYCATLFFQALMLAIAALAGVLLRPLLDIHRVVTSFCPLLIIFIKIRSSTSRFIAMFMIRSPNTTKYVN